MHVSAALDRVKYFVCHRLKNFHRPRFSFSCPSSKGRFELSALRMFLKNVRLHFSLTGLSRDVRNLDTSTFEVARWNGTSRNSGSPAAPSTFDFPPKFSMIGSPFKINTFKPGKAEVAKVANGRFFVTSFGRHSQQWARVFSSSVSWERTFPCVSIEVTST